MTSLSVLVPVYDEEHLVAASLRRLEVLEESPHLSRVQVVVVDDGSRDGTPKALERLVAELGLSPAPEAARPGGEGAPSPSASAYRKPGSKLEWLFLRHERNGGKGKAIRTAIAHADGEISVFHDADLEYHPKDLLRIVETFEAEQADAVFGSRFAGGEARRVLLFRHELGNRLLTFLTNVVTDLNLTDMETCYKAVRTDLLKSIPLVSDDFRLEPELVIKLAKREARIFEVPISYAGRTYQDGKKIGWRDGLRALGAVVAFGLSDDVYARDEHGSAILGRLSRAPRFNAWMADVIRPYCGKRVLEIGSGTGNLTRELVPRQRYVASDVNPLYLRQLATLQEQRPYLEARYCDVADGRSFPGEGQFDTVVCLNVLEHLDDDLGALVNLGRVLAPGGRAIVLVPQGEHLFGTLDDVLGHRRRYTEASLRRLAERAGFAVQEVLHFNRLGTPAWWLNGKVLRRRTFGLGQILALNLMTPVLRRVDGALPFAALSLIAVLERGEEAAGRPGTDDAAAPGEPARGAGR